MQQKQFLSSTEREWRVCFNVIVSTFEIRDFHTWHEKLIAIFTFFSSTSSSLVFFFLFLSLSCFRLFPFHVSFFFFFLFINFMFFLHFSFLSFPYSAFSSIVFLSFSLILNFLSFSHFSLHFSLTFFFSIFHSFSFFFFFFIHFIQTSQDFQIQILYFLFIPNSLKSILVKGVKFYYLFHSWISFHQVRHEICSMLHSFINIVYQCI